MQSRPRAIMTVIGVLLSLAGVAVASALAEVLKYNAIARKLTEFQHSMTESGSQAGLNIEFTHLPAVAIGPTIMVAVVMMVIAAGLVALAFALRRPQPRARVIAFISAGVLAVLAVAQAGIALTSQLSINQIEAEFRGLQDQLQAAQNNLGSQLPNTGPMSFGIEDLFPSWPYYVDYLTSILAVIGCIVIIVLLNRPAAKTWFAATPTGSSLGTPPQEAEFRGHAPSVPVVGDQTITSDQALPKMTPTWAETEH
jgi:hypothetical protein